MPTSFLASNARAVDPATAPHFTTGNVFYVSSTHADRANEAAGGTLKRPFSTIDYAVGQCTASNGDLIIVMPGHVETITAAGGLDLDVAGITILGVGSRRNRPTINFTTATTADMDVDAANITVANLYFECVSVDALAGVIDVNAADFTLRGCELHLADGTNQAEIGVIADASADRMIVEDCHFHGTSDAGTNNAISFGAADDVIIRNNIIEGAHATTGSIGNDAAAINVNIIGNIILNRTADANNKAIVLHASSVGLIANNRMAIIDSTSPAPVTAAAAFVSGNYTTGAVGVSASTLM